MQEGFRQCHGLQCGYCTPGMVMAATALLAEQPDPTDAEIRAGLEGNLCRCTGYQMIVDVGPLGRRTPDHDLARPVARLLGGAGAHDSQAMPSLSPSRRELHRGCSGVML